MEQVYIVAAKRTPIGSFGGSLKNFSATQLGAFAIKAAVESCGISKDVIDEVIMGCVLQAGIGQAPARQAAMFAQLPASVICTTVNKVCASGMKAVMQAAQAIALGDAHVIVAGGMESMSNVPFYQSNIRWGNKYGHVQMTDGLVKDGLTDVYHQYAMGNAAELSATELNITRQQQDDYAINSYQKSQHSVNAGLFTNEITPIEINGKQGLQIMDKDEEPFNVNFDKLKTLKPAFSKEGSITAANASTMNDGAAALVLMSKTKADSLGIKPLAIIKSFADAEQAPEKFSTSPALALPKALQKANLQINDIDLFEINEAFSAVSLANQSLIGIAAEKLNINGGAVSLGHPLGCSGARIIVTLINALQQQNKNLGAAAICNGGGGASAIIVQIN